MDMSLSNMTSCPPWYVSWSVLAMVMFPLVVFPILRKRGVSLSAAPMLLGLAPVFHGSLLAYLALRSVFLGMAIAGTESPVVLSAGFGDAQGILAFAAVISGIVLIVAIVIAARNSRGQVTAASRAGQRVAIILTSSGVLLLLGVFAIPLIAMNSGGPTRMKLFYASVAGAWLTGAVVVLVAIFSAWAVRRASGDIGSSSATSAIRTLVVALGFVVLSGATSWLARDWFIRIATAARVQG